MLKKLIALSFCAALFISFGACSKPPEATQQERTNDVQSRDERPAEEGGTASFVE